MKRLIISISSLALLACLIAIPAFAQAGEKPTKSLHDAVLSGDIEQVRLNISAGAAVNAQDNMGYTPLFYAAQGGRRDVAELLIAGGADVNAKDRTGNTPLHYAAVSGHYDLCELLLTRGADASAKNLMGGTPLAMAQAQNHDAIVELLSSPMAVRSRTEPPELNAASNALHQAVLAGDIKEVQRCISNKDVDINAKNRLSWTPLHVALWEGHKAIAELLILKGADVNAKDNQGYTPLHFAAIKGDPNTTALLIGRAANVNAKGRIGETPLYLAADNGHKDVVELLIAKGADVNAQAGSKNALSVAQEKRHQEIVELLLKHGAKEPTILMEDRLYGPEGQPESRVDLYPGYPGQLQRGGSRAISPEGSLDILADPNEIKARIKTFEGLEKALAEIASKSRLEKGAWLQRETDNRTSLIRAVEEQVKQELTFVQKMAVEEKAEKTTKTIEDVLSRRQQLYEKAHKELLVQKRTLQETQRAAGRSRSRYPSSTTRGRYQTDGYPPGQQPMDNMGRPLTERGTTLPRSYGLRGELDARQQVTAESDKIINEWLQATPDNKNNLLNSVHTEIQTQYVSIRTVAVEEGAKKTTAAIDGLLLSRQARFEDIIIRTERQTQQMQDLRGRNLGQRGMYPQDTSPWGQQPRQGVPGQKQFLEQPQHRTRRQ